MFRLSALARLSVPIATRARDELYLTYPQMRLSGGTGPRVASRARYDRRAGARKLRELRVGQLNAMDCEQPGTQKPEPLAVVHGTRTRNLPGRIPRTDGIKDLAPRAAARLEEFHFRRRFAEMNRHWSSGYVRSQRRQQRRDVPVVVRIAAHTEYGA